MCIRDSHGVGVRCLRVIHRLFLAGVLQRGRLLCRGCLLYTSLRKPKAPKRTNGRRRPAYDCHSDGHHHRGVPVSYTHLNRFCRFCNRQNANVPACGPCSAPWLSLIHILPFSTEGVDFVMTAMFTVIFLNQWEKDKQHYLSLIHI